MFSFCFLRIYRQEKFVMDCLLIDIFHYVRNAYSKTQPSQLSATVLRGPWWPKWAIFLADNLTKFGRSPNFGPPEIRKFTNKAKCGQMLRIESLGHYLEITRERSLLIFTALLSFFLLVPFFFLLYTFLHFLLLLRTFWSLWSFRCPLTAFGFLSASAGKAKVKMKSIQDTIILMVVDFQKKKTNLKTNITW